MLKKLVSIFLCFSFAFGGTSAKPQKAKAAAVAAGAASGSIVGVVGIVVGAVAGLGIYVASEHSKRGSTNPANKSKHEKGQARKKRDKFGGEKGDARRQSRSGKRRRK
jgi:hypothetical protein